MKKRKPLAKFTLLFAVLLTLSAARAQGDILPGVTISFAPVGLTIDQTARLNMVNVDIPNGLLISWRFIDASGLPLAQAVTTLPLGKIVSVDFRRAGASPPPNTDPALSIRAEVRAQIQIVSAGVSGESLRRSLEVFNNDTGATTVCMGGAAP
ncbi:MAG TPA: hypothetical protein VFH87_13435 [Candidatus Udaeobacter sp.]|nr:hypothetical protein [Candidatus Udaeobacter sp.]